jgi:lipopolysaccharide/colanic/teichoic acid biosynthesis glycosyltransferase
MNDGSAMRLANVILERKRSTDEVGWCDDERIGIMLPNSTAEGPRQFAQDISRKLNDTGPSPAYKIYRYPSDRLSIDTTPSHHTFQKTSKETKEKLDHLLSRTIPAWKRALDIIVSTLLLIFLFPLFLVIAIVIQIVSPGPVFFKQKRLGYLGKPFTCWKFRTMSVDADAAVHQKHLHNLIRSEAVMTKLDNTRDPRIIPFGKLLRQTGLDELPQLLNVLRGEMSLVGPRPCLPYESQQYRLWQTRRMDTLPGVTGLWQVSGKNRTTFNEMMRLDLTYVNKSCFWMDMQILLKTVPAVIAQISDHLSNGKDGDYAKCN